MLFYSYNTIWHNHAEGTTLVMGVSGCIINFPLLKQICKISQWVCLTIRSLSWSINFHPTIVISRSDPYHDECLHLCLSKLIESIKSCFIESVMNTLYCINILYFIHVFHDSYHWMVICFMTSTTVWNIYICVLLNLNITEIASLTNVAVHRG